VICVFLTLQLII